MDGADEDSSGLPWSASFNGKDSFSLRILIGPSNTTASFDGKLFLALELEEQLSNVGRSYKDEWNVI